MEVWGGGGGWSVSGEDCRGVLEGSIWCVGGGGGRYGWG